MKSVVAAVLWLALAWCGAASAQTGAPQPALWKAVLIAGDDLELAFDNAVDTLAIRLMGFGVPRANIAILKASGEGPEAATAQNIRAALSELDPGPQGGCFVFVTSHGAPQRGLVMARARAFLSPAALGHLLDRSCGARPTVVVASGCYSGNFADEPPMPEPNRVILTAAREDRPSFGCNAGLRFTAFDKCFLDNLTQGESWRAIMDGTRACVAGTEWDLRVKVPSEPQLSVGGAEGGLRAFSR